MAVIIVVLFPMTWAISHKHSYLCGRFSSSPILLHSFLKTSNYIFWGICTSSSFDTFHEGTELLWATCEIENIKHPLLLLIKVGISNETQPYIAPLAQCSDPFDNGFNFLLADFDPGAHRACAVHYEHQVERLRLEQATRFITNYLQVRVQSLHVSGEFLVHV
jgi:hypothetical protein